jgi:hypothetical protein
MLIHEIIVEQTTFKATDLIEVEDVAAGGVSKKMLLSVLLPALGLANQQLFVNAAGDGLEYGYGSKVVAHTRDMTLASGDVSYTGAGFKPRSVIIFGIYTSSFSIGLGDITTTNYFVELRGVNLASTNWGATALIDLCEDTAVTKYQRASLKSMDNDGCTLTWVKTGSPVAGIGEFYILYLR